MLTARYGAVGGLPHCSEPRSGTGRFQTTHDNRQERRRESQKRWAARRTKLRFWYEPGPEKHQNKNIDQQSTGVGSGQSEEAKAEMSDE